MITNERQFRITKSQLDKLNAVMAGFDLEAATRRTGSRILAEAELAGLKSQASDLSNDLREYEALKSGTITVLKAGTLSELPKILIRARIAKGLSQHALAEKLGLKEQQIQRYEAEGYSSASLRRLAEVADALGLNVTEVAEFTDAQRPKPAGQGSGH